MMTPHLNLKFHVQTNTVLISITISLYIISTSYRDFFTIVAEDSTVLSWKPIAIGGGRESLENIR